MNENSCGAAELEVLLASSGAGSGANIVGAGDAGLHEGSSGLVVQSTWHNISFGFLIHNGSGTGPSVSSGSGEVILPPSGTGEVLLASSGAG